MTSYLKKYNKGELLQITDEYLKALPKGNDLGPKPAKTFAWEEMDYGNFQIGTYEIADEENRKKQKAAKGEQPDYARMKYRL